MDGAGQSNVTPSGSATSIDRRLQALRTSDSASSIGSTGTIVTADGPVAIDPQMYNRFQAFVAMEEKEKEKAKRKRQESGSKKQKPKKQRPC